MPITPAYKWHESDAEVIVEVALRNTSRGQADIMSTECFLKVNSTPYLLQVRRVLTLGISFRILERNGCKSLYGMREEL